ncbi:MAG: hypothetical protein AAFX02_09650, partial [Pseudomonadota bacterium]
MCVIDAKPRLGLADVTRILSKWSHIGCMEGLPPEPMPQSDDNKSGPRQNSANPLLWIAFVVTHLGRQALAIIGLVLVIISVPIAMATPFIPIGLPIGIVGVVLLGRNS